MVTPEQIERVQALLSAWDTSSVRPLAVRLFDDDRDALAALLAAVEADPLTRLGKWLLPGVREVAKMYHDTKGYHIELYDVDDYTPRSDHIADSICAALTAALDAAERGQDHA